MQKLLIILSFILASVLTQVHPNIHYSILEDIFRKRSYEKFAFPYYGNSTVDVFWGMTIENVYIDDTDALVLNAVMRYQWFDLRLQWNARKFDNICLTLADSDAIWKPEITVYNFADGSRLNHYSHSKAVIDCHGLVDWNPAGEFRVTCPLEITYWPFDEHNCTIFFGSWTENGWQTRLLPETELNLMDVERPEILRHWKLLNATYRLTYLENYWAGDSLPVLAVDIEIKRSSPYFAVTVVLPAVAIALLTLIQFLLPMEHPQRITIGCCNTMLVMLVLLYLTHTLPLSGRSVPIIVKFYGEVLLVVVLSVAVCSFTLRVFRQENPLMSFPPPAFLRKLFHGPLGTILLIRKVVPQMVPKISSSEGPESVYDQFSVNPNYAQDWIPITDAANRVSAIAFTVTVITMLIAFMAPLH